jgi:hypothetical protein
MSCKKKRMREREFDVPAERKAGVACSQLSFLVNEAGALCQCICDAVGYGSNCNNGIVEYLIEDGIDDGRDDGAVRHLVLVDKAAFANRAAMKCVPKSGVRLAFVSSVWDVSRAAEGLRNLRSVSVVVGAESSKRSVLRCGGSEGKFVYAALVEIARLTELDTVYVYGIDEGAIAAYLDFNPDECDKRAVTVIASGADWEVAWSSTGNLTRAQASHEDNLFSTRPVLSGK